MTATASSPTRTPTAPAPASPETAALDPTSAPRRDPLAVLDHRSRGRVVLRDQALPGHYLALADEDGDRHMIPLADKVLHIGRAVTADLRFEDPHVSRRHAIICRYGRHVRVLDDRSSGGTFVNGVRVVACDVQPGDVVRVGPIAFTYTVIR